jgi:hypothetical protein
LFENEEIDYQVKRAELLKEQMFLQEHMAGMKKKPARTGDRHTEKEDTVHGPEIGE